MKKENQHKSHLCSRICLNKLSNHMRIFNSKANPVKKATQLKKNKRAESKSLATRKNAIEKQNKSKIKKRLISAKFA